MPSFLFTPAPNKDAVRFLAAKAPVAREVFDGLLPELRGLAFTITGVESMAVLKKARERLSGLPAGGDWDEIKKGLAADLVPYLGEEGGVKRAELLLRVHGYSAYSAAQYQVMDRQRDVFPWWQYHSADDGHVRASHAALDGHIFPANSDFWRTHFPPWEHGCRCFIIVLSDDDVSEIRAADAKKVPEARRVVEGDRLKLAETQGTLMTTRGGANGIPAQVDVRSPREKSGGSGFYHNPGDLHVDLPALQATYTKTPEGAAAFAVFETWAKRQPLRKGETATVWDWLQPRPGPGGGAQLAGAPRPPIGPRPWRELPPLPRPPAEPRRSPVSAALDLSVLSGPEAALATHALRLIDLAHDDGALPPVRIVLERAPGQDGGFYQARDGTYRVSFRPSSPRPLLTLLEEIGHLLDYTALGPVPAQWGSEVSPAFVALRRALYATQAVTAMRALPYTETREFLPEHEIFARAYAQWIGTRADHPAALAELRQELASTKGWRYWSAEDFAPVAAALENVLPAFPWKTSF